MKKKTLLIYSLVLILSLSCIGGYRSYAGTALISTGRMEFDNNTPEPEDDAIFDVDDLKALNTKISEAEAEINNIETSINNSKKEIVNILNQNPNINIGEEVSFPDIITYIQGSTNVPADTYFYEKGTEGSAAIVRYKKVGGKYYKCDANGKVAQGAQEVNVSGKQLEDYAGTKAGNLSAGAAGYANGGFYLGDGSDNAAYQNRAKVGTATTPDVLAGKTFTSTAGVGLTGTMVNRGTLNWNPTSNATQTVQPGYYSGGTLNSAGAYNKGKTDGATQSKVGTASAGDVLAGKTFTNSTSVGATGTMVNNGAWSNTPTSKGKVTIPAGYHNGSGYVDSTSVYNKGMTDADARVNKNSESYIKGYADAKSGLDIKGYRAFFSHSSSNSTGSYQTYMFTSAVDDPLFIIVQNSDVSLASSNGELFYEVWHNGNASVRLYALIGAKDGTTLYHNSTGGSWPAYTIFKPTY